MNFNQKLHPEIRQHLERVQETMSRAHLMTAAEMRDTFHQLRMEPADDIHVHQITDLVIPAQHGNIHCRLYKPSTENNLPVLVWFHGGGWVLGDLDSADYPCRHLATESGCMILSVDYRLAPEHPFPAAYDDCLAALSWTVNNCEQIGADKHRIAVGGDSAGANLAACVCIAARDQNLDVKFQLLVYPVVEADFDNQSYSDNADNYFLTRNLMKWFWNQYVPAHAQRNDARVAPLASHLEGLPQAWVLTVNFDPLRDEGIRYAEALKAAGVDVATTQADDTVHGFFTMPVSGGAAARKDAAIQLKNALS